MIRNKFLYLILFFLVIGIIRNLFIIDSQKNRFKDTTSNTNSQQNRVEDTNDIIDTLENTITTLRLQKYQCNIKSKKKDDTIDTQDQTINTQDKTIKKKDQTIKKKDQTITTQNQTLKRQDKILKEKDKTLKYTYVFIVLFVIISFIIYFRNKDNTITKETLESKQNIFNTELAKKQEQQKNLREYITILQKRLRGKQEQNNKLGQQRRNLYNQLRAKKLQNEHLNTKRRKSEADMRKFKADMRKVSTIYADELEAISAGLEANLIKDDLLIKDDKNKKTDKLDNLLIEIERPLDD